MTPADAPASGDKAAAETAAKAKALDDAKLQQVVALLEAALERVDGAATARTMLAQMRPQLIDMRPPRRPALKRIFCTPFEDMLVDGVAAGHMVGRIPRTVIEPVWALFLERGDKAVIAKAQANLGDKAAINALHEHFAKLMRGELDDASAYAAKGHALLARLGGEANYLALDAIVGVVSIARHIARLKEVLPPKPIRDIRDSHYEPLAEVLNQILKVSSERVATALFIVMARMAEPWKITGVLEALAANGLFKSSAGIREFSSAALVGRLENEVQEVLSYAAAPPVEGDKPVSKGDAAAAIAKDVNDAVQNLAGTKDALEKAGNTAQLREVERARQRLRTLVDEKVVSGSARAIVDSVARAGGRATAVGKPPDQKTLREAELRAIALKRSSAYSSILTLDGDVTSNLEQATAGVEKAASDLCGDIRRAKLDGAGREAALAHVMANARLMEILAGPDKAEALFNRGVEAVNAP